jgi:hypothetical protein
MVSETNAARFRNDIFNSEMLEVEKEVEAKWTESYEEPKKDTV